MMRMRTKLSSSSLSPKPTTAAAGDGGVGDGCGGEERSTDWEVRPCGMLVQKRSDLDLNSAPPVPMIKVKVKYGSVYHEICISSQATFGELKKKLQETTGLHHQDQKLYYKDKERDSKTFLDVVGLKDKSKIVLVEDPLSQEKRYLEMRKNAKMEKAAKSISQISLEVDRLSIQVSALESTIKVGGKVTEKEVLNLTELLMNELVKLDSIIVSDGEVKLQKKMQVRRVQKYVETLDMIKLKSSTATSSGGQIASQNQQKSNRHLPNGNTSNGQTSNGHKPSPIHHLKPKHSMGHSSPRPPRPPPHPQRPQQEARNSTSATVVTTQWETFESGSPLIPVSSPEPAPLVPLSPKSAEPPLVPISPKSAEPPLVPLSPKSVSVQYSSITANHTSNHKFNWESFE